MKKKCDAFDYALNLISIRDRSEGEIIDKLKQKKYPDSDIKVALEKLKMYNYINDKKFAENFALSRFATGKSVNFIKAALKKFAVSDEIISETIQKLKPDFDDELNKALLLAQKKIKKDLPPQKNASRISGFLARRGFNWDVISKVLERLNLHLKEMYYEDQKGFTECL